MSYIPEDALLHLVFPCPELVRHFAGQAKKLAPDTKKEIYGWCGAEIEIIYQCSANGLTERIKHKTDESELERLASEIEKTAEALSKITGDEEKIANLLQMFGKQRGTPFSV